MGNLQFRVDQLELLTNGKEKYWDAKKGYSWRLDQKGGLSEYHYLNKVRMEANTGDYVITYHRWGIKSDTIFEMDGATVIGEYRILRLTKDTMILKSVFGTYGKDTLFFQSSKDQISDIKRDEGVIRLVE